MRNIIRGTVLAVILTLVFGLALAETEPVTRQEIETLAEQVRALADVSAVLNDPAGEDADSEDGYAFQFFFGTVYADQPVWNGETRIRAFQIMEQSLTGPRGLGIDAEVNRVMEAVPCDNPEMNGTYRQAALYLAGDAETGFSYGRVERDGQRISAMEYGVADPAEETWVRLVFAIADDGISAIRAEGMNEAFSREAAADLYAELSALTGEAGYRRVPRSLNGADLEMFQESDLDFSALSYRTAQPWIFDDNVEEMMIDNGDGHWLHRVDGDGFEAVFLQDSPEGEARLISYSILSPDLEGPRCVRLGDLFHEDLCRFRNGEGGLDESGLREVLYGTEGTAPWGLADYSDGGEITLRYVTPTLGGPDVELILRYQDTVLSGIILHTLEDEEE